MAAQAKAKANDLATEYEIKDKLHKAKGKSPLQRLLFSFSS